MITANGLIQLGFTPEVDFVLQNNGGDTFFSEWNSEKPQPTEKEITDAHIIWQAEWNAQEYARKRATAYPTIGDQLDEIYHNGIDSWKAVIKVTKDKYPKG